MYLIVALQLSQATPQRFSVTKMMKMLIRIGAPLVCLQLLVLIANHPGTLVHDSNLDAVEFYAGKHEVTKAQWRRNLVGYPYDKLLDDEFMNINTPLGISYIHIGGLVRTNI